jgi:RNA polymerase sigma factor (sigma-70 family)
MILRQARAGEVSDNTDPPHDGPLPDEEIIRIERTAQLEYAMEQLDDRCHRLLREIFLSHEHATYREIAERLGIPLNSLGPTRSRCLKRLRRILNDLNWVLVLIVAGRALLS